MLSQFRFILNKKAVHGSAIDFIYLRCSSMNETYSVVFFKDDNVHEFNFLK